MPVTRYNRSLSKVPLPLALTYLIAGLLGLLASFMLTLSRFAILENPDAKLSCDFSLIVQCGANLQSDAGALFGFPNPLIGLVVFPALIFMGMGLLAKISFPKWFWILFGLGVTAGTAFVGFLIYTSIFVLGTLCPWCMLVWLTMIPVFWITIFHLFGTVQILPHQSIIKISNILKSWVPLITFFSYLLIGVLAQVRLDILSYL